MAVGVVATSHGEDGIRSAAPWLGIDRDFLGSGGGSIAEDVEGVGGPRGVEEGVTSFLAVTGHVGIESSSLDFSIPRLEAPCGALLVPALSADFGSTGDAGYEGILGEEAFETGERGTVTVRTPVVSSIRKCRIII